MMDSISEASPKTARDYLKIIFRRLPIVMLVVMTVTGVVLAGLLFKKPVYQAQVKMLISAKKQVESPYYRDLTTNSNAEKITVTQSEIVKSAPVLERTVQALGLHVPSAPRIIRKPKGLQKIYNQMMAKYFPQPAKPLNSEKEETAIRFRKAVDKLRKNVEVQPIRDTNTFTISVKDSDPERAALLANVISRSYVIFDLEQQLAELLLKYGGKHPSVIQIRDHINRVYQRLNGVFISNEEAIGPASVKIIEQASPPMRPKGVAKRIVLGFALVMSLSLGMILAFIFDYADPRLKSPEDVYEVFGMPLLGVIPKARSQKEDFVRTLARQIVLKAGDAKAKVFLFCAVDVPSCASSVISELADYLAEYAGLKILILDVNFKKPLLHHRYKIPNQPGVKQILSNFVTWNQAVKTVRDRLCLIPSGTSRESVWIDQDAWNQLLEKVKPNFDLIFVHAESLNKSQDAKVLMSLADKTAVVVEERKTRREVAKAALHALSSKKEDLIGTIVTNRSFPVPGWIYNNI